MKAPLKVSIVMPVYNGGRYFDLAVQSALAQTYDNVEIVIVNDGSTDGGVTDMIGRTYAAQYPAKVKYILQENSGTGGALNRGIQAMTGDIFCWLSHDDLFEPDKTAAQVDFFRVLGRNDAILISDYRLIGPQGELIQDVVFDHAMALAAPRLPLYRGWVNGCTIFVPAHLLDKAHAFEPQYRHVQDYRLWHKLLQDHEIFHMPRLLVRYRIHPGQDSQRPDAVGEGEDLWRHMLDSCTAVERAQMSGSTWRYFDQLHRHLNGSMYKGTAVYAAQRRDAALVDTLVSVVIPVFNEIDLAARAVRSVQAQTHRKLEILVIDDGSSEPLGALETIVRQDARVRLVRQANAGPGAARNRGLDLTRGEYIAFLDADDLFLEEKIERQLEAMQLSGAQISHTSYYLTYPEARPGYGLLNSGRFNGHVYPEILERCLIATPTVMLHRLLLAEGLRFPTDIRLGEDVLTWIEAVQSHRLLGLDDPLTVVEWSKDSAALDPGKSASGLAQQLACLQRHPVHSRHRQQLRMLGRAQIYAADLARLARHSRVEYEDLIEAAFGPPGAELKSADMTPKVSFDPDAHDLNVLARAALGRRRHDVDLAGKYHSFKHPQPLSGDARGAAFGTGAVPWDYIAGIGLAPDLAATGHVLEVVVERTPETLYVLMVDRAYHQVGPRLTVEPGLGMVSRWFDLTAVSGFSALVIQAEEKPSSSPARVVRVSVFTEKAVGR